MFESKFVCSCSGIFFGFSIFAMWVFLGHPEAQADGNITPSLSERYFDEAVRVQSSGFDFDDTYQAKLYNDLKAALSKAKEAWSHYVFSYCSVSKKLNPQNKEACSEELQKLGAHLVWRDFILEHPQMSGYDRTLLAEPERPEFTKGLPEKPVSTELSNVTNLDSASEACKEADNTFEITHCMQDENEKVAELFKLYFDEAALIQAENIRNPEEVQEKMLRAQETWEETRHDFCSAVYQNWVQGTVRFIKFESCVRELTEIKTHMVWRDFIFVNQSHPYSSKLPEPKRPELAHWLPSEPVKARTEQEYIASLSDPDITVTSIETHRKRAAAGDAEAQWWLGNLHYTEGGALRNLEKAKSFFERAASQGNKRAKTKLETFYKANFK